MEEMNLGQSSEVSAPVTSSAPMETSTPSEKSLPQSQVNELVGRAKHEAIESYKRQQANSQGQAAPSNYRNENAESMSESNYRKIAAEEAQRLRDQWVSDANSRSEQDNAQRIVQTFWDKMAAGKDSYEDFDKVTSDIEYARFPNVVQLLAEHIDNSHDVLYELGKDRLKMAQLEQLSQMSPKDALVHTRRLAESIKENQAANRMKYPNAPLSQQRPSTSGTESGGALSFAQLKAKYRV